jgi:nucleotide-binding universal stress UspA family protein
MSYRTLMAASIAGRANAQMLAATAAIAGKLQAGVIGIAACRPIHCIYRDYAIPAVAFEQDRKQMDQQIHDAELEFRAAMAGLAGSIDWRGHTCLEPLAAHLAEESVSADLIVAAMDAPGAAVDATRQPDLCDLVMQAGRPVLLVAGSRPTPAFDRVLIAWKDTREARRAIADALPLLAKATSVMVVAMEDSSRGADARSGVARAGAWLGRHGIAAKTSVVPARTANAPQLIGIAREMKADLIVAGAYGYSRHGQWVLGGITSELLGGNQCALLSH